MKLLGRQPNDKTRQVGGKTRQVGGKTRQVDRKTRQVDRKMRQVDDRMRPRNFKTQRAFTMIEIAISLAVIAFALVAIIGVLPTGMNVQKDNREDTIINQDGPFWLALIRNGNIGLDYLTNYVDSITVHTFGKDSAGAAVDFTIIYTTNTPIIFPMTNGARIVGLLGIPKYEPRGIYFVTNSVVAKSRALTGSATEQGQANPDFAFTYLMTPEVTGFMGSIGSTNSIDFNDPAITNIPAEVTVRKTEWVRQRNSHEIKLTFRWPVFQNDQTGPGRQSFRAIASGRHTNIVNQGWFFRPLEFDSPSP